MMREIIRINANILWIDYNEKENPPLHISISTSHVMTLCIREKLNEFFFIIEAGKIIWRSFRTYFIQSV